MRAAHRHLGVVEAFRHQAEVATRRQLATLGVTSDVVRSQCRARRWQRAGAKAVVLHNGMLTADQRRWVALLNQCDGAALAGATAAELAGLCGFESTDVYVLVPHGARAVRLPGVVVHSSRRLGADDVQPMRVPRRVRVERAVVDAARWEPRPRRAAAILAAAVQQRLTSPARLRTELRRCWADRRVRLLRLVVDDIVGGAQSLAEIDLGALCRRAGIPPPLRQVVRRDASGRRRYLDAVCDGFTVEVDGGFHVEPLTWIDDTVRQNDLVIAGERVLRVPSVLIRVAPGDVIAQLRRAHERLTPPDPPTARTCTPTPAR